MTSSVANRNPWAWLGLKDYFTNLVAKLPPGAASGGAEMWALCLGVANIFADIGAAAAQLSEVETIPETTQVLLPNWELDYGLPDCCSVTGASYNQRIQALLGKIAAIGGASAAYFISIAAALGWAITITEGSAGSFTWTINASLTAPVSVFTAGASVAGDLLENFGSNAQLECYMNRIKPAHTILIFSYT